MRERAAKLDQVHPHLLSCRVVVGRVTRRHHQGNVFAVRFDVKAKGHEFAITRRADEDPFVALRESFDAARRRLEGLAQALRGDVKAHSR